jgi:hypothetical protein
MSCQSVYLSVSLWKNLTLTGQVHAKVDIGRVFSTFVNTLKLWLKPNKNNVHFKHIRSSGYYTPVVLQWLHLLPRFFFFSMVTFAALVS